MIGEAVSIWQPVRAPTDRKMAEADNALGARLSLLGKPVEGEPLLLRGFEILRDTPGVPELVRRRARTFLVAHYDRTGQPALAARYRASEAAR
ncbi:MAG: hypothetical protein ACREUF_05250 [Solimonas sp.]